jgi:hypothetical protein
MTSKARQTDEKYLEMLALRCAGQRPEAIAKALGVSAAGVKTQTCAIRREDEAEAAKSGESLAGAYWPAKSGPGKKRAGQ